MSFYCACFSFSYSISSFYFWSSSSSLSRYSLLKGWVSSTIYSWPNSIFCWGCNGSAIFFSCSAVEPLKSYSLSISIGMFSLFSWTCFSAWTGCAADCCWTTSYYWSFYCYYCGYVYCLSSGLAFETSFCETFLPIFYMGVYAGSSSFKILTRVPLAFNFLMRSSTDSSS